MVAISLEAVNVVDTGLLIPNTKILTDGTLTGVGVFDVLMKITKAHIQEEYDKGQIVGKEYSAVYLGALNAVLSQSIQYIVNHQQTAKLNADIGLIRQKAVTELAQTADTIPAALGFNEGTTILGLLKDQKALLAQQILTATSEVTKSEREVVLLGQKIITEVAQTDDAIGILAEPYMLNGASTILGVVNAQINKTDADTDLVKQKVMTELANTDDTLSADAATYAKNGTTTVEGLMAIQKNKGTSEVNLLNQKTASEEAQTADITTTGLSPGAVLGVIGKQKSLFTAQTDGFKRDAEQKLTKIMVDTLNTQIVSDSGTPIPTGLDNTSLNAILTIAKAGIGG